jgi:ditrans,polycis-polyprenyl diphosphate synthase
MTAHNTRAILNLCMPYTAQDDMVSAIERTAAQVLAGEIEPEHVDEHAIEANLMTSLVDSPSLDILVRTSGVHRLSDFMLWQVSVSCTGFLVSLVIYGIRSIFQCCEDTQIQFVSTYWPDFGMRDFIPIILAYQRKIWARKRQELKSLVVKSE